MAGKQVPNGRSLAPGTRTIRQQEPEQKRKRELESDALDAIKVVFEKVLDEVTPLDVKLKIAPDSPAVILPPTGARTMPSPLLTLAELSGRMWGTTTAGGWTVLFEGRNVGSFLRRSLRSGLTRRGFLALAAVAAISGCEGSDSPTLTAGGGNEAETTRGALAESAQLTTWPFALGVASGDPLPDRVVIWTRLAYPRQVPAALPSSRRWPTVDCA